VAGSLTGTLAVRKLPDNCGMRSAEDYVMVAMVITSLYGNLTHLARQWGSN